MDEQQTSPYGNAVQWLEQGVKPAEVVTRLKASGLGAEEISLLLSAAARKLRENGKSIDLADVIIPVDQADRGAMEASADAQASSGPGSGLNGSAMLGGALIVIGVGIFFISGGRFIAYGMVIVGILRLVRGMSDGR